MKNRVTRLIATTTSLLLLAGLAACGQDAADTKAEQTKKEQQKEQAMKELGATSLPSGLTGECEGDDPRLPSVKLSTTGQYLGVEIPGNDQIQAKEHWSYVITVNGSVTTMVGFKNMLATGEANRYVFNMGNGKQKNYGAGDASAVSGGVFSASIPDAAVKGNEGTEWSAVLNVDGKDMASCPATGTSKFE